MLASLCFSCFLSSLANSSIFASFFSRCAFSKSTVMRSTIAFSRGQLIHPSYANHPPTPIRIAAMIRCFQRKPASGSAMISSPLGAGAGALDEGTASVVMMIHILLRRRRRRFSLHANDDGFFERFEHPPRRRQRVFHRLLSLGESFRRQVR